MIKEFKAFKGRFEGVLLDISAILNNGVELRGMQLRNGSKGYWVSTPSQKSTKVGDNGKPVYYPHYKIPKELEADIIKRAEAHLGQDQDPWGGR